MGKKMGKRKNKAFRIKLLLLGTEDSEKESIINQYAENKYSMDFLPILGADISIHEIEYQGKLLNLNIWNIGDASIVTPKARGQFAQGAGVMILMFNLGNSESLLQIEQILAEFVTMNSEIPKILVGNNPANRVITYAQATSFAQANKIRYIDLTPENINLTFLTAGLLAIHEKLPPILERVFLEKAIEPLEEYIIVEKLSLNAENWGEISLPIKSKPSDILTEKFDQIWERLNQAEKVGNLIEKIEKFQWKNGPSMILGLLHQREDILVRLQEELDEALRTNKEKQNKIVEIMQTGGKTGDVVKKPLPMQEALDKMIADIDEH